VPLVFIHGVNTRYDRQYETDVSARDELFRRLVIHPLAKTCGISAQLPILNPYWGDKGVAFSWGQASLPVVSTLEHMGGESSNDTPASDADISAFVARTTGTIRNLESMGAADSRFKLAALADLPRFVEAVLSPMILSERSLAVEGVETPSISGKREALLLIAAAEAATDHELRILLEDSSSDEDVLRLISEAVCERYRSALDVEQQSTSHLERMGSRWLEPIVDEVRELFARAKDAPGRASTVPASAIWREKLHRQFSTFFGDVFMYLKNRGTSGAPGPIVEAVWEPIRARQKSHPDEPLIVVTHSMGGNIFYDIVSTFAPDLEITAWISVGGQVGQFEEMKLFLASDPEVRGPEKVRTYYPRLRYWMNIYDPADPFSFKAAPIFHDVSDVEYLTGGSVLRSHGTYFKRPSFHRLIHEELQKLFL
jgi:hypothetical protein